MKRKVENGVTNGRTNTNFRPSEDNQMLSSHLSTHCRFIPPTHHCQCVPVAQWQNEIYMFHAKKAPNVEVRSQYVYVL